MKNWEYDINPSKLISNLQYTIVTDTESVRSI